MGLVRITSWYPNFNGSHFGLSPCEIHKMTGLPPKIVWTMTCLHRPHCTLPYTSPCLHNITRWDRKKGVSVADLDDHRLHGVKQDPSLNCRSPNEKTKEKIIQLKKKKKANKLKLNVYLCWTAALIQWNELRPLQAVLCDGHFLKITQCALTRLPTQLIMKLIEKQNNMHRNGVTVQIQEFECKLLLLCPRSTCLTPIWRHTSTSSYSLHIRRKVEASSANLRLP